VHDAALTWLASHRDDNGSSLSSLTHATEQSHQQATDALLANWSPFDLGLGGYLRRA